MFNRLHPYRCLKPIAIAKMTHKELLEHIKSPELTRCGADAIFAALCQSETVPLLSYECMHGCIRALHSRMRVMHRKESKNLDDESKAINSKRVGDEDDGEPLISKDEKWFDARSQFSYSDCEDQPESEEATKQAVKLRDR